MLSAKEPALSRSEWIVLSLVCEGPTHGNAVSRLVGPDGDLGQIWRVPRGVVYRSLDRLSDLSGADRYETASATVRFLDDLVLTPPQPSDRT